MSTLPSEPTPRPTVLLVDDEARIRAVLRLGLGAEFEVEEARSANEAELMMATKHYDVIVCDHMMPDEEGLSFLMRARKLFPKTQRIMMTGYVNPELLSRSTDLAGLAGCVMKPISASKLAESIRFALPR
jgi:CheY-like chemotaxis protein